MQDPKPVQTPKPPTTPNVPPTPMPPMPKNGVTSFRETVPMSDEPADEPVTTLQERELR